LTHTQPVDAYRGAGRPEAAYVLERLVDTCARQLKMPREEIRAKNFVKSSDMPYKTLTDRTYDVGDFEGAMRTSLAKAEYEQFKHRADESRKRGQLRGFGFSSYIECTAWGAGEEGSVMLDEEGRFTVLIGTQSNGQGHETAYAQVVSQYLDVPVDQITVVQGDTRRVASGNGTGGSRSIPVGSAMLARASEKLVMQLKELAADELEAAAADLEVADGQVKIVGTDRSLSYRDIANLAQATPEKLTAIDTYTPSDATYPNGTHCCEVEIDPDTGVTKIVRYTIVDDFGLTLNPMLLAGQVHGGISQGIGQALMERTVFSDEGQLLTASFMDYCLPRAGDLPTFNFETRNIPSTTNPLGLKGAGEAGSIGSCPAVMNAVVDALHRAYGITHIDMPATPQVVFSAIHAAGGHDAPNRAAHPIVARASAPVAKKQPALSEPETAEPPPAAMEPRPRRLKPPGPRTGARKKAGAKKAGKAAAKKTRRAAVKKVAVKKAAVKKKGGRRSTLKTVAKIAGRKSTGKKAIAKKAAKKKSATKKTVKKPTKRMSRAARKPTRRGPTSRRSPRR
jgi:carbon-monoxide dehydrogenase large subunit